MIRIRIPGVPPSANHAYLNLPHGRRGLTKEGQRYKNETKSFIAQKYPTAMGMFQPNEEYTVVFQFTVLPEDFYTSTFGKKGGSTAKLKKWDISNRVKLLEDAFKDATSIDDSCTTVLAVRKVPGDRAFTTIMVWASEREVDPLTEILEQYNPSEEL